MYDCRKFFIDGQWVAPTGRRELQVINPATEEAVGVILLGTKEDVDAATRAARVAFESYSRTTREERIALLTRVIQVYEASIPRLARALSDEMGAPMERDMRAPFGGYKQSGNGREWGREGFKEFLEIKSVMGYFAT